MKKIIIIMFVCCITTMVFATGTSEPADATSIVVASDATWPPMEFLNDQKEIVGFDVDVMNEVGKRAGLSVTIQNTAWDGIFAGLVNGNYDAVISSVTITEERQKTMDFSDPYINAGQVLIVATDEPASVQTLNDLAGKTVGAQLGTTGAFEIEKYSNVSLQTYDELGFAIADLANGQIAGVVADTPIAADFVFQNQAYANKLKIVGVPFTEEWYGIVVQKGNQELLDKINTALAGMEADGTLASFRSKWLQ